MMFEHYMVIVFMVSMVVWEAYTTKEKNPVTKIISIIGLAGGLYIIYKYVWT